MLIVLLILEGLQTRSNRPRLKRVSKRRGVTFSGTSTGRSHVNRKVEAKPQAILRDAVYPRRFSELSRDRPCRRDREPSHRLWRFMRICVYRRTRRQRSNDLGHPSQAVTDTNAFGVTASIMIARTLA